MLKVDNLTFEVNEEGRKRCLVDHISFQVEDGEMLVITGPNGGGKSTLAKVLAGIDLWSFSMLIKRFEEIHQEKKECLILISHQERIIRMADKIMVIEDGKVKQYGKSEDVLPSLFQQEKCQKCVTGMEGGVC